MEFVGISGTIVRVRGDGFIEVLNFGGVDEEENSRDELEETHENGGDVKLHFVEGRMDAI